MPFSPLPLRRATRVRAPLARLGVEALEDRQLLSASGMSGYASNEILVRFKANAPALVGSQILSGTTIGPAIGLVPGLRAVSLSSGVSVSQALAAYGANANVLYAQPDYLVHSAALPNDSYFGSYQNNLFNTGQNGGTPGDDINVAPAWNVTTGNHNIIVATIDSGIDYNNPDLAANVWTNPNVAADASTYPNGIYGWNFVSNSPNVMDDFGHGTHVAGIIGAVGNNGTGVAGVAWNVQIMALKMLDSTGSGSTANAVLAMNYAVSHGAKIINMSWNGGPYSQAFYDAIQNAGAQGVLVVCSAGNGGTNNDSTLSYPASYNLPNMISVAATDASNNMASFTNFGSTVSLTAPGVNILSTYTGNQYVFASGTSMAAPEVAGAAVLLWSADPSLTVAEVKQRLLGGTTYIGNVGNNASMPTQTNGLLNVGNSIKPDLTWQNLTAPASLQVGQSFALTGAFRISGSTVANDFNITYYLSTDGVFDPATDTILGTDAVGGNDAVGFYNGNSNGMTIGQAGTYTIFAKLDGGNSVNEFSEGNNVSAGIAVQVGGGSTGGGTTSTPGAISIADASALQPTSGTVNMVFSVTLAQAVTGTVTVNYATADSTARAGIDYTATSGTLTFSPGQTTKTITVAVVGTTLSQFNKTFLVNLSSPGNATLTRASAQGNIVNQNLIASDTFGYKAVVYPYEAIDLSPTYPGATTLIKSGDNTSATLSLGTSTFSFYGTSYNKLYVNSNGMITFGSSSNSSSNTNLSRNPSQATIAPLWDDWVSTTSSPMVMTLFQDTTGDGKADRLIVEWNNVQIAGGKAVPQTFQTILQLNTGMKAGEIIFNYAFLNSQDSHAFGATATVGIKGAGSQGGNRLLIDYNNTGVPYLANAAAIRITASNPFASASSVANTVVLPTSSSNSAPSASSATKSFPVGLRTNALPQAFVPASVLASIATAWQTKKNDNAAVLEALFAGKKSEPGANGHDSAAHASGLSSSASFDFKVLKSPW